MKSTNPDGSVAMPGDGGVNVKAAEQFASEGGGDLGFRYLMANTGERDRMMANETSLREDEWETTSDTVVRVRQQSLDLVNALQDAGLTKNLSLASLTSTWPTISSPFNDEGADISMNPDDRASSDDIEYLLDGVPLPVFYKDWHIDRRMLMASRNEGAGLDQLVPSLMAREVSYQVENTFLNGWSSNVDGYQLYGFTNHPDRNTTSAPASWSDGTTDDEDIRTTFIRCIEALEDDEFAAGGNHVILHRDEWQQLRAVLDDLGSGGAATASMRERVMEEFDTEIDNFIVSPHIPSGEMVMYQPAPEVVQLGLAENIQPVQWESPSGWRLHFKMMGAMTLELRSTYDSQMGVVHATGL